MKRFLPFILITAILAGGGWYGWQEVQKFQQTRSQATVSQIKFSIQPAPIKLKGKTTVQVWANSEEAVSQFHTEIKFDPKVVQISGKINTPENILGRNTTVTDPETANNTGNIIIEAKVEEKEKGNLPKGAFLVAVFHLEAVDPATETAELTIEGQNPAADSGANRGSKSENGNDQQEDAQPTKMESQTADDKETAAVTPTVRPTGGVGQQTAAVTVVPTRVMTGLGSSGNKTRTEVVSPVLKFRVSFFGIGGEAKCADPAKMPLTVMVRAADGTVKKYEKIFAKKVTGVTETWGVYEVIMTLTGMSANSDLAVFVKGPKHLMMKYGVNNQEAFYAEPGGQISGLTDSPATTPLFHFEKFPLLAGDVTGPNGIQDGVVNGLDFAYVKDQAQKRASVAEGGEMKADINGNCQMESLDLAGLMLSMSSVMEQNY